MKNFAFTLGIFILMIGYVWSQCDVDDCLECENGEPLVCLQCRYGFAVDDSGGCYQYVGCPDDFLSVYEGGEYKCFKVIDSLKTRNDAYDYCLSTYGALGESVGLSSVKTDEYYNDTFKPWLEGNVDTTNCENRFWMGMKSRSNLVAYFPLDGSASDMSKNQFEAVEYGTTPTTDRFGNPNSALAFGTGNYVALNMYYSYTDFIFNLTVCAWAKMDDASGDQIILSFDRSEYYRLEARSDDLTNLYAPGWGSSCPVDGANDLHNSDYIVNDNDWHHYCYWYQENDKRMYLDGVLIANDMMTCTNGLGEPSKLRYGFIGSGCEATSLNGVHTPWNWFLGDIDEIVIYNRGISEEEISELMDGVVPDLFWEWDLDETNVTISDWVSTTVVSPYGDCAMLLMGYDAGEGDLFGFFEVPCDETYESDWKTQACPICEIKAPYVSPDDDYFRLEDGSGSDLGITAVYACTENARVSSRSRSSAFYFQNRNLYVFGGYGLDSNNDTGYLNDIWYLNMESMQWCFVKGSLTMNEEQDDILSSPPALSQFFDSPRPSSRASHASFATHFSFFVFGGEGVRSSSSLYSTNDLWEYAVIHRTHSGRWRLIQNDDGYDYPWLSSALPSRRSDACIAHATYTSNTLYLFGGQNYVSSSMEYYNDLWTYDISSNTFTRLRDATFTDTFSDTEMFLVSENYQTNDPDPSIDPPRRSKSACWVSSSSSDSNFYLFGGEFSNKYSTNDLWVYNSSISMWSFLLGGNDTESSSIVEMEGVYHQNNLPSARSGMTTFFPQQSYTGDQTVMYLFFGGGDGRLGVQYGDMWEFSSELVMFKFSNGTTDGVFSGGSSSVDGEGDLIGARSFGVGILRPDSSVYIFGGEVMG